MTYQTVDSTRRRTLLAVFAALFIAGVVAIFFMTRPKPTVEERINQEFQKAQEAAQRGDIGGATAILSNDFKAGGINKQRVKLLLFQARRQSQDINWKVEVAPPTVLAAPDNAPDKRLVVTRVTARDASTGGELWSTGGSPVTLLMREEDSRLLGVFPVRTWRIVSAPSLPSF